ncbi:emp24/gp25L/p24 family protein [Purpureocillium lavendulum]|uniref:Emp24/gp25L/p24 family protein n=1 Tax=Purpureocillium lavendulum TaxID=1247861 RepID=A0AB34G395_9HYPO|nr:emp24/gp25L/p24 family protein [Purpureocillium lavendulum]
MVYDPHPFPGPHPHLRRQEDMASYFVTGASRGLGLGICTALAARPAADVSVVFAAVRTETDALKRLVAGSAGRVQAVSVDVTSESGVQDAAAKVEQSLGGKGLDVVVNSAGVMPYTADGIWNMKDLTPTLDTNVTSAHLVTAALLPLLRKGTMKKVVNLSSTLGSIGMAATFHLSPSPAYKISKAALNMLTVQYALSLADEGFTVITISPGWVKTDMGGSRADIDVETSVNATLDIVSRAKTADTGKFFNIHVPGYEDAPGINQYDGGQPPW